MIQLVAEEPPLSYRFNIANGDLSWQLQTAIPPGKDLISDWFTVRGETEDDYASILAYSLAIDNLHHIRDSDTLVARAFDTFGQDLVHGWNQPKQATDRAHLETLMSGYQAVHQSLKIVRDRFILASC